MTPNEAEIKFFTSEEAKRIQEEWEPKFGDFFIRPGADKWEIVDAELLVILSFGIEAFFLPRQGQLWEMLEEVTGREEGQIGLEGPYPTPETRYGVNISSETGYIYHEAPTPSIALGKCLLEVLKEEK